MGIEIDGLAGLFALSLPLAALATVVFLAARDARRKVALDIAPRQTRTAPPGAATESTDAPEPQSLALAKSAAAPLTAPGLAQDMPLDLQVCAARELAGAGKSDEAAAVFRDCLWEAGRQGRQDIQGEARRDLGDLCLNAGDTITACEHWQIARGYFSDLKRGDDVTDVERRMKLNGCPTDWVLNDF